MLGGKERLMSDNQKIMDEQQEMMKQFVKTFPGVLTVEDVMRLALRLHKQVDDASDEIERLRKINFSVAEHNSTENANQLRIVRAVEAERDRWRTVAKMMIAQVDPESPAWAEYWKVLRGG